jgi:hypothetical protein
MQSRLDDIELLTGVENVDETLDSAVHVWNAFWGPLSPKYLVKETLINNKDLVFALVEATVPKLISKLIASEEKMLNFESKLMQQHDNMLELLSVLTTVNQSYCTEVETNELPTWKLTVVLNNTVFEYEISHNEYVKYFSHVRIA